MKIEKGQLYNILSLVCGSWFLLTGWMWTYFANLFISYPVGLIGLFLWYQGRKVNPGSLLNKIALVALIAGLICSLGAILIFK
jgi:hypothetical protein